MRISIIALCLLWAGVAHANTELDAAIANVRAACNGISSELGELKKMAGINTAVTGVGTSAAVVALGTGLAKANTDSKIEAIEKRLRELENRVDEIDEEEDDYGTIFIDGSDVPINGYYE